jgi:uroporphyrinogen-III synthase
MTVAPPIALQDSHIVVLRPAAQAARTVAALVAAGARATAAPMIAINLRATDEIAREIVSLHGNRQIDIVISVSTYAGDALGRAADAHPAAADVLRQAMHLAIGSATRTALATAHLPVEMATTTDNREDSESLLATAALDTVAIRGKHIVLAAGSSANGGRKLLAETLTARGATVNTLIGYTRRPNLLDAAERREFQATLATATHVLAGSVETLDALLENIGVEAFSALPHLLVPHARVADAARQRGASNISVVSLNGNKLVDDWQALRI